MESFSEHEQKSFYKPATYKWTPSRYSLETQKLALLIFLFLLVNSSLCRKGTRQTFSVQQPQTKAQPQVLLFLRRDLLPVRNSSVPPKTVSLPQINASLYSLQLLHVHQGPPSLPLRLQVYFENGRSLPWWKALLKWMCASDPTNWGLVLRVTKSQFCFAGYMSNTMSLLQVSYQSYLINV